MATKKSKVDLDKLPRSMKKKTRTGLFSSSYDVKENRKPQTEKERKGEVDINTDLLSDYSKEELRAINKILAKSKEREREKFEKKVQQKMGSFNKGGYVRCGASVPGTHKKK